MSLCQDQNVPMTLIDLISFEDQEFIYSAYLALLGRTPDPDGFGYYLARLRAGASKIEILAQIRLSAEGQKYPVNISGLDKAFRRHRWLKIPIIGKLLHYVGFKPVNSERLYTASGNEAATKDDEIPGYFDADWYLKQYADVAASGMSPFDHYRLFGKAEGRLPAFDNKLLLDDNRMIFIDKVPPARQAKGRIAIHLHLYYLDLADEFAQYLSHMPFAYDLFVSVANKDGIEICQKAFSALTNQRQLIIEAVPNRGRDIAPLFCAFGPRLKNYDYIAHFHSKKSLYNQGATDGWRKYLCDTLLGSKEQIQRIFTLMQGDTPYGIVYPQNYVLLPYAANTWLANRGMGAAWCARLGINPVPQGYFDFPAGSMFWARVDALQPLFAAGITLEDFAEEAGQTDGTFAHCLERLLALAAMKQGYRPGIIRDLQHPTWSAWGFQQYADRTFDYMVRQMLDPGIKLIAFDIFDTLLCRPLMDAESIKTIVAERMGGSAGQRYLQYRASAEEQARNAVGKDIGMEDIYASLGKLTGLSAATLSQLRRLEEDVEKASVTVRSGGMELYQQALRSGKPVILLSDMFLPKTVIEESLQTSGITGWSKFFLSNEIGLRKDRGDLYAHVFTEYGITPGELLMVGDNERSDLQIPWDIGSKVIHLLRPLEFARGLPRFCSLINNNERSRDLNVELSLGLVLQQNFAASSYPQLDPASLVQPTPFNIGYSVIGPLLLGFCQWLGESARRDGIDRLYFLSREGQLLKSVYDLWHKGLAEAPPSEYLILSRRAVSVPALKNLEDILQIARTTYFKNTLGNFLFERYGLQLAPERWKKLNAQLQWHKNRELEVHDQNIKQLVPLLKALESEILATAGREESALRAYLKSMGLGKSERQAVVDVGYGATIQDYLNRLGPSPLHGYYMITDQRAALVTRSHNVLIRGCYLEDVVSNGNAPLMFLKTFELEKLLSSDDPQVVRYKLNRKNKLTAEYRELSTEETGCSRIRAGFRNGAIQYVQDARIVREQLYPGYKPSCEIGKQLFEAFNTHQSQLEEEIVRGIALDDHYCGRGIVL
jgi:FMN phosphatase YigB (HAD superfamily)